MLNDTATTASTASRTQRETFSATITPVDEKRFESEIRRTDAAVSDEKKNREKFETRIEKNIYDLRGEMKDLRSDMKDLRSDMKDLRDEMNLRFEKTDRDMKDLRGEMNTRMNRLDDRLWWIFGAVLISILLPIVMKYLMKYL
ncbi:MAG: hypothetical protein LBJ36_04280 [Synergistaceae bacterium]|jgi:predicted  nucleic acid-binding Zn-ribbon protein|nr:hypothetical protein [Synergistaceae bacterium]